MLHLYYKWRYERKARSGAFELPKTGADGPGETINLGSYLSQLYGQRRGFKHYDLPRKRRKMMRRVAIVLGISLLAWITYESIIALALLAN